jgi:hypothetical protein
MTVKHRPATYSNVYIPIPVIPVKPICSAISATTAVFTAVEEAAVVAAQALKISITSETIGKMVHFNVRGAMPQFRMQPVRPTLL